MAVDKKANFISSFVKDTLHADLVKHPMRKLATEALEKLEIPTTRWEAWKYTSTKQVVEQSYENAEAFSLDSLDPYLIPGLEADLMVFVNGHYQPELSSMNLNGDAIRLRSLKGLEGEDKVIFDQHFGQHAKADHDVFSALNTAYAEEGVFIHVPKGHIASHPIHILHLSSVEKTSAIQTRNLLVLEAMAEIKVVETYANLGGQSNFRNVFSEIVVGKNAGGEWIKIQQEGDDSMILDHTEVYQEDHSRFSTYTITLSASWVRNNLHFNLEGEQTESHLKGMYLLSDKMHVDNFTNVDHRQAHCYSNELYKGILTDQSSGVFNGKIYVFPDAQKTNAFQSNRNILLSEKASMNTKPQLEIYADDVKCSHGATTGQIDEDALFYLRARGIPKLEAQKLMVHAFAAEVIDDLSLEPVKEYLDELIWKRFV